MKKIILFFIIGFCFNCKLNPPQNKILSTNSNNFILLEKHRDKLFSYPNKKDKFSISIIGENILNGKMIFKIINSNGIELLNETYPSNVLINGYIIDENTTDEEKINMIKKRVSSFFDDKNFIFPAINSSDIIDTDYSNSEIWNDIKSNPKALGFYYLIGDELGCKLAYSKKQKKIVKYFCCC
tara:strand:+ start:571 stop:1119 length:549 start_codon:yes stop_codon:yes gene_type:complete